MKTTPNQRLRQFRTALNLSPTELATALKVSVSLIQKTETGNMEVSEKLAAQIQQKFKLPAAWLMEGKGEMTYEIPQNETSPWRDEAYQVIKDQLAKKDIIIDRLTQALLGNKSFLQGLNGTGRARTRSLRPQTAAAAAA
jgi:transcriptional regulator with XRE-family HTH domain